MVSMNSRLVETVSINYEDFNESFLTCGTCLCMYDGGEHTPKLLPCSHTVCLHCLLRIANPLSSPTFRCPICRENITIPRGGVPALPPSFLVNQLLDLMASQRREVIPKCSVHLTQELLFCETCDTVFCSQCTGGSHSSVGVSTCEHTVIPFSIAIKRMSEILLYKANECISKLSDANEAVSGEVSKLEIAAQLCLDHVEAAFAEVHAVVDARKKSVVEALATVRDAKHKVLTNQISLIQAEKDKVTSECEGLQYQVEVRNISQRISSLAEKLDSVSSLAEPRENSFLACDLPCTDVLPRLAQVLDDLGRVRTTTTFPSLSTLSVEGHCIANLECTAVLTTVDYHGNLRFTGGDPIVAKVQCAPEGGIEEVGTNSRLEVELLDSSIDDRGDGTYFIKFRPLKPGKYEVSVSVVERCVKNSPLVVEVVQHNNPVGTYGSRGSGKDQFLQPVAVAYDGTTNTVYVVDTGNCRVKMLTPDLALVRHIENDSLQERSCTGIACYTGEENWLVAINWRTRLVTRFTTKGETLSAFTYSGFEEPIDVAVDSTYGHILVADNGPSCVFVFDTEGKFLFQVGKKGSRKGCFNLISSVAVGPKSEIVVSDSRIQVFSAKGDFVLEIFPEGKGKGRYGGVSVDKEGRIVASRSEKSRNFLQVFDMESGSLLSTIDSHDSKLKRPSGVGTTNDYHVIVVDLANDCIKKYRYW
ncbi:hypothetical protein AAG570_009913 [Ranatra chinensis]|uniref:Tripartite motif-containing protein 2-like n=1 Tax=Ranatra chinensis TaxID=642074 RepID=A0ABD0Z190_9HEMI